MQVAVLREHGDLGLGTFESLDGEMVVVDGHSFQVRSDGSVREGQDSALSPFAAVTAFSGKCPQRELWRPRAGIRCAVLVHA